MKKNERYPRTQCPEVNAEQILENSLLLSHKIHIYLAMFGPKEMAVFFYYLKCQHFKLIKPADRETPILLPSKRECAGSHRKPRHCLVPLPSEPLYPFLCYPHFSRTPGRLAHIQLKPLLSFLSLSRTLMLLLVYRQLPARPYNSVILSPLPFTPFLFPTPLPPPVLPRLRVSKRGLHETLGTTHCGMGT